MKDPLDNIVRLAFAVGERAKVLQASDHNHEYAAARMVEQCRELNAACQEVQNFVLGVPQPPPRL